MVRTSRTQHIMGEFMGYYTGSDEHFSAQSAWAHLSHAYGHLLAHDAAVALDLNRFHLGKGAHHEGRNMGCVMEFASQLAGERWTDSPQCVSFIIGMTLRTWNDSLDDTTRQRLRSFAFRALDTNTSPEDDEVRQWLALDWTIRTALAVWLDAAGHPDRAIELRAMAPIQSNEQLEVFARYFGEWGMMTEFADFSPSLVRHTSPGDVRLANVAQMCLWKTGVECLPLTAPGRVIMQRVRFAIACLSAIVVDRSYAEGNGAVEALAALSRQLHESGLGVVAAMCEVGRTPVVETKVRVIAKTHDKEAWLDESEVAPAVVAVRTASAE